MVRRFGWIAPPLVAALLAAAALSPGCVPTPVPAKNDFLSALSSIVLDPNRDCEDLRRHFQLQYLPDADNPGDIGMVYEEHFIPRDDNNLLHAWYMPTNLNRGLVIISIGSSSQMKCYLFIARLLARNGWSAVIYEYQGFGLSTGKPSLTSLDTDLETIVDWARRYTGRDQVSLLGISLGTLPSIAVAARRPDAVNGIVLDSPVALASELQRFQFLLGGDARPFIERLDPALVSEKEITNVRQPMLMFLHGRDALTTPQQTQLLYDLAGGPKRLVEFPDLDHAHGLYLDTDVYLFHLDTFLASIWQPNKEEAGSAAETK